MRLNVGWASVLCAALLCQAALADDPPAPPAAEQKAAPSGEAKSTATDAAKQNAADSPTSIKPGLTVTSSKPELTPRDKELLARGYKLEMRHGEKYFCRSETQIESRFPIKNCDTAESIEAHRASGQEALRTIQSDRSHVSN